MVTKSTTLTIPSMLTKSSQSGWILWTQPEVTRLPDFVNIAGFCHLLSTPLRQISAKPAHLKFFSSPINNNVIFLQANPLVLIKLRLVFCCSFCCSFCVPCCASPATPNHFCSRLIQYTALSLLPAAAQSPHLSAPVPLQRDWLICPSHGRGLTTGEPLPPASGVGKP